MSTNNLSQRSVVLEFLNLLSNQVHANWACLAWFDRRFKNPWLRPVLAGLSSKGLILIKLSTNNLSQRSVILEFLSLLSNQVHANWACLAWFDRRFKNTWLRPVLAGLSSKGLILQISLIKTQVFMLDFVTISSTQSQWFFKFWQKD